MLSRIARCVLVLLLYPIACCFPRVRTWVDRQIAIIKNTPPQQPLAPPQQPLAPPQLQDTTATTVAAAVKHTLTPPPQPPAITQAAATKSLELTPADIQNLATIRKPLIDFLQTYFQLDSLGYITGKKQNFMDLLTQNEQTVIGLFYTVSNNGDAAYAEDIRTTLAGMNIASQSIEKGTRAPLLPGVRPVSFTTSKGSNTGIQEPPTYRSSSKKTAPAYIDAWGAAIWNGNRNLRRSGSVNNSHKTSDKAFTPAQIADYKRRVERVQGLHKNGLLIGRVANMGEVKDFIGNRYGMGNDILSTTLWPRENAPIVMQLFSEYGKDTVGVLLDPTRVGEDNFGVSFSSNAGTVGSGFLRHKHRRATDGASTLSAQHGLLEALSNAVSSGGSVTDVTYAVAPDRKSYAIQKVDARSQGAGKKNKQVLWNEQTFYRGVERDFFTALFVKSESDNFSAELKELFVLQDRIRRKKGIYVPIFQFKGSNNQLEEIIPDPILLSITGALDVSAIPGAESPFTKKLKLAGITESMALRMSANIGTLSVKAKSLFELQLLMFNMKDITGKISVQQQQSHGVFAYTPIRIIDNLHLVFPTTFKTQNTSAKDPDSFFYPTDVQAILKNPDLHNYLKATLTYNIARFLGIAVDQTGSISFDISKAGLFDATDLKKSDFAKVLARSLQTAVLFQIYGQNTNPIVQAIAVEARKHWSNLGFTPSGIDMILGNKEMQTILASSPPLTQATEPQKGVDKPIPPQTFSIDQFDPFRKSTLSALSTQTQTVILFLYSLGINVDGTLNDKLIGEYQASDPHLREYETAVMSAAHFLSAVGQKTLVTTLLTNLQMKYPCFGKTAEGKSMEENSSDLLMKWLQNDVQDLPSSTEFPFGQPIGSAPVGGPPSQAAVQAPMRRVRGHAAQVEEAPEEAQPIRGRRGQMLAATAVASPAQVKAVMPSLRDSELIQISTDLLPTFDPAQIQAAKRLGLMDSKNTPLWQVVPAFHGGDTGKPVAPYIAVRDLLGHFVSHLLTGPAYHPQTLKGDRDSFEIAIDPSIVKKDQLSHLITDTLAVTTEGDEQVLRANGLQYSKAVTVPSGGNIAYSGGNEKHFFRSNTQRRYMAPTYQYAGGYDSAALSAVETHDKMLLSDADRRIKRAGVLQSAYVTVTAIGGYGSERKPLPKAHKVLYVATAGPQFEKYGRGDFTYQDGTKDSNELESADFIIKAGAPANSQPLIDYFGGTGIPAHGAIQPAVCSQLDDGDFTKEFVVLKDGSYFNRKAYVQSVERYVGDLVLPVVKQRTQNKPYYLKAILFGGGFFADAGKAGNLRSLVIHAMLKAYITAITSGKVPAGSVIEFPHYGDLTSSPTKFFIEELNAAAQSKGVDIVWSEKGDVCDYTTQTTLSGKTVNPEDFEKQGALVALGAADAMSWHGNEPSSASLEASFANNSNLRLVMNWWANPVVLQQVHRLSQ